MGHYKSNVRDLEFNMFEVLGMNEAPDAIATASAMHNEVLPVPPAAIVNVTWWR